MQSTTRTHKRSFVSKVLVAFACALGAVACSAGDDGFTDDDVFDEDEDEEVGTSSDAHSVAGACAGTAMARAVRCAQSKGARVLSFYRSPADQERVRRQNGCRNRCTGMAGCVRPTADCTSSPHTRCRAVDLVNDGAPVSRAGLRACGLAKTTLPHRNHYDLVR